MQMFNQIFQATVRVESAGVGHHIYGASADRVSLPASNRLAVDDLAPTTQTDETTHLGP